MSTEIPDYLWADRDYRESRARITPSGVDMEQIRAAGVRYGLGLTFDDQTAVYRNLDGETAEFLLGRHVSGSGYQCSFQNHFVRPYLTNFAGFGVGEFSFHGSIFPGKRSGWHHFVIDVPDLGTAIHLLECFFCAVGIVPRTLYMFCLSWATEQAKDQLKEIFKSKVRVSFCLKFGWDWLTVFVHYKTETTVDILILGEDVFEGYGLETRAFEADHRDVDSMDRVMEILAPRISAWERYNALVKKWGPGAVNEESRRLCR